MAMSTALPDSDRAADQNMWDPVMGSYHDDILGPYHPQADSNEFLDSLHRAITEHAARNDRPVTILDAGCGPGNALTYLSRWGIAVDYTGIDISPAATRIATARARAAGIAHNIKCADMLSALPTQQRPQYDIVIAVNSVLPVAVQQHPRADVIAMLSLLRDCTAPGGDLLLVLPAHDALLAELAYRAASGTDSAALDRKHLVDRLHRLADNGFGVQHCLHDPHTLRRELPAAGIDATVRALTYPAELAAHWCQSHRCWDWLVHAKPSRG